MYALIKQFDEIARVQDYRMTRRGGAVPGVLITILAVVGLMVVLSAVF